MDERIRTFAPCRCSGSCACRSHAAGLLPLAAAVLGLALVDRTNLTSPEHGYPHTECPPVMLHPAPSAPATTGQSQPAVPTTVLVLGDACPSPDVTWTECVRAPGQNQSIPGARTVWTPDYTRLLIVPAALGCPTSAASSPDRQARQQQCESITPRYWPPRWDRGGSAVASGRGRWTLSPMDSRIDDLQCVAGRMRTAIEAARDAGEAEGTEMAAFPRGQCDFTSEFLASYLTELGFGESELVAGERQGLEHHAWLERGGIILDITADQFVGEGRPPVIVTTDRGWHAQFHENRREIACLRLDDIPDVKARRGLQEFHRCVRDRLRDAWAT